MNSTLEKILHSKKHITNVDKNITKILDEDVHFYEFIHIANKSKTRMDEWNTKSLTNFERWSEIFEFVRSECISLKTHNSFWNSFLPFMVLLQL
jgi:GH35 family endo-1,4-beta-xylanase